ncbi:MAG: regulatory protein RecX [bacterium]
MMSAPDPILQACQRADGTVTLCLSNGEILEVAPAVLAGAMPQLGEPIPAELLGRLRLAAQRKQIARRLFRILDRKLHPVAVLRRKLVDEGFDSHEVETVLAEFAAQDLFSDRRFAEAFCRDTLRRRPVGRRYLFARLHERQVAPDVVDAVVAELLPADLELELALVASRQRWAKIPGPADRNNEARVFRFLLNSGFPAGTARRAARDGAEPSADKAGEENG